MKKGVIISKLGHHYTVGDIVNVRFDNYYHSWIAYPSRTKLKYADDFWQIVSGSNFEFIIDFNLNTNTRVI